MKKTKPKYNERCILCQLEVKDRMKAKKIFNKVIENRKKMIENFNELIIKPLKDNIEINKKFLRSQESIGKTLHHNKIINKRLMEILKWIQ